MRPINALTAAILAVSACLAGCSPSPATQQSAVVEPGTAEHLVDQSVVSKPQSTPPVTPSHAETPWHADVSEEVEAGEPEMFVFDNLCEAVAQPALTAYLSATLTDEEWSQEMLKWVLPSAVDLVHRPAAEEILWVTTMPTDGSAQTWCEARTSTAMWLIGISYPDGTPLIHTLQSNQ